MKTVWFATGAFLAAASIAAGALGAHALKRMLEAPALELWHTAARVTFPWVICSSRVR